LATTDSSVLAKVGGFKTFMTYHSLASFEFILYI